MSLLGIIGNSVITPDSIREYAEKRGNIRSFYRTTFFEGCLQDGFCYTSSDSTGSGPGGLTTLGLRLQIFSSYFLSF